MSVDHRRILDLARAGDWDGAHRLVQLHTDSLSCQIHAWLHRVDGDDWNADYWYRKAGMTRPDNTREQELERIARLIGC